MHYKTLADDPIFERNKVTYNTKGCIITHLKVQNESMFIVLHNKENKSWLLQHVKIQNSKATDIKLDISLTDSVSKLFLDTTGKHCIITTKKGENYYINSKYLKVIQLKRLKGIIITSIGWNPDTDSDSGTGFIVIGTNTSSLYETNINNNGSILYFKLLKESMSKEQTLPITDIYLFIVPFSGLDKWICFICLPGQLHILTAIINTAQSTQQYGSFMGTFSEVPNVLTPMFNFSELPKHRYLKPGLKLCSGLTLGPIEPGVLPTRYAWINEDGISIGSVDLTKDVDNYDLIEEKKILKHEKALGLIQYPIDIEMTEFHVMVLYKNRVSAYSAYNYKKFFNEEFQQDKINNCGLSRDTSSHLIWMFNENIIWKYRPNKEKRFVWKVFLENNDFIKSREITKTMEDKKPFYLVVKKQAESLYNSGKYIEAVKCYYECKHPFDSVVLMFMQQQDLQKRSALKLYLTLKLNSETDQIRITLLVMWIMEIYLSEISDFRRNNDDKDKIPTGIMSSTEKAIKEHREKFKKFMEKPLILHVLEENLNAVYRLILSHMDYETHIQLSTIIRDYETLIRIYLLQNNYKEALNVIKDSGRAKLFYKFAPDILPEIPVDFLNSLIENDRVLLPEKLLPAFYKVMGNNDLIAVGFNYFTHVINNTTNATSPVHNFLILLYAEYKPHFLLEHLKSFGMDRDDIPYDPGYALRLCIRKNMNDCCVFLYRIESMYESAVKLALQIDINLAKECAKDLIYSNTTRELSFMENDTTDDVSKHVWLTIARYMINNNFDIKDVLELIKESNNIVTVGDLLPLFPEFTDIEALKEPLCECLQGTSDNINNLQKQIRETAEIMDALKNDLEERNRRINKAKTTDKCNYCNDYAMKKTFVMFNCGHFLHMTCFEEYMLCRFDRDKQAKFQYLRKEYKNLEEQYIKDESPVTKGKMKVLKNLIEEMLGKECPLCGILAIELIDKPFFTSDDYSIEMSKWKF